MFRTHYYKKQNEKFLKLFKKLVQKEEEKPANINQNEIKKGIFNSIHDFIANKSEILENKLFFEKKNVHGQDKYYIKIKGCKLEDKLYKELLNIKFVESNQQAVLFANKHWLKYLQVYLKEHNIPITELCGKINDLSDSN